VQISPRFFDAGGFSTFTLNGIGLPGSGPENYIPGVNITPGTKIKPLVKNWVAVSHAIGSGTHELRPYLRPEGIRSPANLGFHSLGAVDPYTGLPVIRADLVIGQGSSIKTEGYGNLSFSGDTVTVLGSIKAPGGSIRIAGGNSFVQQQPSTTTPFATVYIGSTASLSTAGKEVTYLHPRGWRSGEVLPGGQITVSGNIIAERGAMFDVSGSKGVLDLPVTYQGVSRRYVTGFRGVEYAPVQYETNGGSIKLTGSQMLYTDATFVGRPGGSSAIGGSLSVSSGVFHPAGIAYTSADQNLIVQQNGVTLPNSTFARGVGLALRSASGSILPGIGNLSISSFSGGEFDSLTLGGNVKFAGPVSIAVPGALRVASGGVIYGDSAINLTASYAALGQDFRPPALESESISRFQSD